MDVNRNVNQDVNQGQDRDEVSRALARHQAAAIAWRAVLAMVVGAVIVTLVAVLLGHAAQQTTDDGLTVVDVSHLNQHVNRDVNRDIPADVVVKVTGTAATGFVVHHAGGLVEYLPTRSEADAECSEYHRRVNRTRCHVEIRTTFRDLRTLERALTWAGER